MEPSVIPENDEAGVAEMVRCRRYEENVALYSVGNTALVFASFAMWLVFSCGQGSRRGGGMGRLTTFWGAGLVTCGLFLASTWPEVPSDCGAAAGGSFATYTYLTIFSGVLWVLRGKRMLHAERRRRLNWGGLDDDIAIASEAPVEARFSGRVVVSRGAVDLDDGDAPLLSGEEDGGDGDEIDEDGESLDDDASVEAGGDACELTNVCVVDAAELNSPR